MPLKIEYMNIAELVSYEKNSRLHSNIQVEQIVASIKEFGFTNPVLIDEDNILIAGHGRTAAAKLAGMDQVPAIRLVGLSDNQKKALRIADNQLPQNATWDMDLLASEIRDLEIDDFDIDVLGFDPAYLDEILEGVEDDESEGESESHEDIAPAPPENPVSQIGDVWVLGKHRLFCGDSVSEGDVSNLMNGEIADMVFTDPPYLMDFTGTMNNDGTKSHSSVHGAIKNDKMSREDGDRFISDVVKNIKRFCRGAYYICFYRLGMDYVFRALDENKLPTKAVIIWHKPGGTLSNSDYKSMYEPIFYGWVKDHDFHGGKAEWDLWTINKTKKNDLHPTMKPLELVERAIKNSSKRGEVVLDLFGGSGSGSTLIACENTGRKARLMELDPKYVDVIIKRWQELTGKKAVHESLKVTFDEVADSRAA